MQKTEIDNNAEIIFMKNTKYLKKYAENIY